MIIINNIAQYNLGRATKLRLPAKGENGSQLPIITMDKVVISKVLDGQL
jgi:hypothetical protein